MRGFTLKACPGCPERSRSKQNRRVHPEGKARFYGRSPRPEPYGSGPRRVPALLGVEVLVLLGLLLAATAPDLIGASRAPTWGKLSGIVVDENGTPQMGATVWVISEHGLGGAPVKLFTNDRGIFSANRLLPGLYSVRVTLASYLPAVKSRVAVDLKRPGFLTVRLDSILTSLSALHRPAQADVDPDEWKWVVRTSPISRPVLRMVGREEPQVQEAGKRNGESGRRVKDRMMAELSSGTGRRGSLNHSLGTFGSGFAYEHNLAGTAKLLFAGDFGYQRGLAAAFSTLWLPNGSFEEGSHASFSLRQSFMPGGMRSDVPGAVPYFRAVRTRYGSQIPLGGSFLLRYEVEYQAVGLGGRRQAILPAASLVYEVNANTRLTLRVATQPGGLPSPDSLLRAALNELDQFPAMMLRDGRPIFQTGLYEEVGYEQRLGPNALFQAAAFYEQLHHTSVRGRGDAGLALDPANFLSDLAAGGFAYDGGGVRTNGFRVGYSRKFSDQWEASFGYGLAGALTAHSRALSDIAELRDLLHSRYQQSLMARVVTRLPQYGTRVVASYRWISGDVVAPPDVFNESFTLADPHLNLEVRQPLPGFFVFPAGRVEARADFRNLLAQGYVPIRSSDGRVIYLIPAFRTFRGSVSFQF